MLRYAFTNNQNRVFQKFSVFHLQVGILMWIALCFELLIACLQFYHLTYNPTKIDGDFVSGFRPLHIPASLLVDVCAFIVLPLAVYGTFSIRAPFCVPFLFFSFVSSLESLVICVVCLIHYGQTHCAQNLYNGIWFASALLFHCFATIVAFFFTVFAQKFTYYIVYEKHLIDTDCLFQLERKRGHELLMAQAKTQTQTQNLTPS